jgi:Rps23 Pro-64 3,4-dihydroxylase Tpa1-like proline 4-hydroxylase
MATTLAAPADVRTRSAPWAARRPPPWVVLDEFLVAQELASLLRFATTRVRSFQVSEVLAGRHESLVDTGSRRSRVLFELGGFEGLFRQRVLWSLPYVLARLGLPAFPVSDIEVQLTVTHDGGFFRPHFDDDERSALGRRITFVYYFAREPRRFRGGDLQLFASRAPDTRVDGVPRWRVQPGQNQCVFFESTRLHEVLPVQCASSDFSDGRHTVNGWIHSPAGARS